MRLFKFTFNYTVPDTENSSSGKIKGLVQVKDDLLDVKGCDAHIKKYLKEKYETKHYYVHNIKTYQIPII